MMSFFNGWKAAIVAFLVCIAAIPVNAQQTRMFSFQLNPKTYLGIQMEDVSAEKVAKYKLNSERGVIVRSVMKGSPAEAANLQVDDVILEFAGTQVWSSKQLSRLVEETPPGRKVELTVSRDGKRLNLSAQVREGSNRELVDQAEIFPRDFLGPNGRLFEFRTPDPLNRPDRPDRITNIKPRLGVTLQPLTDQLAEYFGVEGKKGVLVSSVAANSPSSGKLFSGDVIVSADGKKIEDPDDLIQLVQNAEASISLKVVRNKKEITVVINLPADEKKDDKGYRL
jgi:serine protease Do